MFEAKSVIRIIWYNDDLPEVSHLCSEMQVIHNVGKSSLSDFPDCSTFHFYDIYFAPISQKVRILFS